MLTFYSSLRQLAAILATFWLIGCSEAPSSAAASNPFCSSSESASQECSYRLNGNAFRILSSAPEMPVEQNIRLTLLSEEPMQIEHSEIRGLSMYMGRLPVVWDPVDATTWQADIILGACTDATMRWQLTLSIRDEKGSHSEQLPFQSVIR